MPTGLRRILMQRQRLTLQVDGIGADLVFRGIFRGPLARGLRAGDTRHRLVEMHVLACGSGVRCDLWDAR